MALVLTKGRSRVIGSLHNELLIFDPASSSLERHAFDTDVILVLGSAADLVVCELMEHDPRYLPLRVVVIDAKDGAEKTAELLVGEDVVDWQGDTHLWPKLPRLFFTRFAPGQEVLVLRQDEPGDVRLVRVPRVPELTDGEWPLHALLMGDRSVILGRGTVGLSVVVYDLAEDRVVRSIPLPAPLSNGPSPVLHLEESTMWVACGGTLVRLDFSSPGNVLARDVAYWRDDQIGGLAFDSEFTTGAVALFSSGVILSFDPDTLEVSHKAETTWSLRDVTLLDHDQFVAQVWDSDRFVVGALRQVPFALPSV